MEAMLKNHVSPSQILYKGAKVTYMTVSAPITLRFLDSFNFVPIPLASMPKAFGFDEAKGTFPFLFLRKENMGKVFDRLPDKRFYAPETMKKARVS
jgi:hypothetical protein